MEIEPNSHRDSWHSWPSCTGEIEQRHVEDGVLEYVFPVPVPEKLWNDRARWCLQKDQYASMSPHDIARAGSQIETVVVAERVEKIVLRGKGTFLGRVLAFDILCPGEPMERFHDPSPERQACILDHITSHDYDAGPGCCWYCDESIPEDSEECPSCGRGQSRDAPTLGELVEKYGTDARVFVYFHDRDVSLNVSYTLDEEGLAKEKAERKAKYEAEWVEYEELRAQWQDLAERVRAYNAAKTEIEEREQFARLKEKYGE
jgi:hypothetical protein